MLLHNYKYHDIKVDQTSAQRGANQLNCASTLTTTWKQTQVEIAWHQFEKVHKYSI